MEHNSNTDNRIYTSINIIGAILFILFEILSMTIFNNGSEFKLLLRVLSRGVLSVLFIFNACYLLLTNRWSFLSIGITHKKRIFIGTLIGLVGLGLFITALLGYGTNGDPRLLWWK
jgi:Na+-driven multidrug efflux pump